MKLNIELPEDQAAALAAKAQAQGVSAEEYARRVLRHDLVPEWLQNSWETSEKTSLNELSMDEIDAEIAAARRERRESRSQPGA